MKRTIFPRFGGIGAILSLLALSAPAQTLPVTTGLQLWLKADAGVTATTAGEVTAWVDQSGKGNNAQQTDAAKAPVLEPNSLNGKPTLRFPGSAKFLDVANSGSIASLTEDVTILTLVKYDDLTGGYRCVLGKTAGNGPAPFDWWNIASANNGRTVFWLGNGVPAQNTSFVSTAAPVVGVYNVMGFSWGNGTVDHYLNDVSNGHFAYTVVPADGGGTLRIGSRADLVTQLKGNLAEVLVYQPALSDADRTAVIGYLAAKYALAFNLPPTVSIQSPSTGSTATTPGSIATSINATDPDGTVARVDLLNNGALVASFTQSPYALTLDLLNPGTAVLTAVAVDNLGRSSTSAPVSITVTGAALTSPVSAGLKMWLRADAGITADANGLVSAWGDQSGSGNDAAQVDPASAPLLAANVINGKPVLRFGANAFSDNQFLDVPEAGTSFTASDFSTFVVARFDNFASYRALWMKPSAGLAGPLDWWFAPNTGIPNAFRGDGTVFGGPVSGTRGAPIGRFETIGLTVGGQAVSHYFSFADNGSGTITATAANAGTPLRIGRRDDGAVQMQGDIAEILLYDRVLSATERSNVVNYLSSKYGMVQAVIGNQPPSISVTNPANNGTLAIGSVAAFGVTASDADGRVTRVDLRANGAVVASLTNSPYQVYLEYMTPGTVTLTGVAVDNWGAQATSAPVVLTVTGSGPTAPPATDLRLWLRADDGVQTNADGTVAAWSDKSGNNNNAAPGFTAPSLVSSAVNGRPAVSFDGVDNFLEIPSSQSIQFAGDISSFALVKFDDFATFRALWAKTAGSLPASVDYYVLPNSGVPRFYRGNGAASNGFLDANRALKAGDYVLLGYDMAGTTATHYINGSAAGSGQITAALADGGTPLKIGTRDDVGTKFKGSIAELLVFGRALSEADRNQVMNYLGAKYGMALVRVINLAPTVALTSPANGSTMAAPGVLTVAAQATDPDNAIDRVELLADGVVMASIKTTPYSIQLQVSTPGTLMLQARAVDVWGTLGTSAPVTVTFTGTGPAEPPKSGLALWLKADAGVTTNADGTVSAWADQSGIGNNATQIDPGSAPVLVKDTVTGNLALRFEAGTKYLSVASAPGIVIESDISSFAAVDLAETPGVSTVWSKTSTGRAYPWDYYIAGGSPTVVRGNADGFQAIASTTPVRAGRPAVTAFTIEGAFTQHYLNGNTNGSGAMGYGAGDLGTPLLIGTADDLLDPFNGNLSEILIYKRALSASEVQLANAYLAARNGVAIVQVATLPTQPTLTIAKAQADTLRISWPVGYSGFVLESRTDAGSGTWSSVATNPPNNEVIVGTTNVTRFFRLRAQ